MDSNIIQDAIESGDPSAASEAIREIDSRVQRLTSSEEKAGLLLNTAVLLGILGCFEEAREALVAALRQNPDDAQTRLRFDYIDGCLYHQEAKAAEASRVSPPFYPNVLGERAESQHYARLAKPD